MVKKYIYTCGFCSAELNIETGHTSLPKDSDGYSMQKLKLRIEQLEKQVKKSKPDLVPADPDPDKKIKTEEKKVNEKGSSWL